MYGLLNTVHLTEICWSRLTANWSGGERPATCHHRKRSEWRVDV